MLTKPLAECDEAELKLVAAQSLADAERFKQALNDYAFAVRIRQRALAMLRDRFGVDAKTGRRLRKKVGKGRGELDLTG